MNKSTHFLATALLILLAGCTTNPFQSVEEAEYQKFVLEREGGVKLDSITLGKMPALQEQVYIESGIPDFIKHGQLKSIDDMERFYQKAIIEKYSEHLSQDFLKGKFIHYAINYFDLTHSENPEEQQYLVRLTRDLMATKYLDTQFNYDCLAACKGKIDKGEYNSLVKRAKFQTRWQIEQFNKMISDCKVLPSQFEQGISKEKLNRLNTSHEQSMAILIKRSEQNLADLDQLMIQ